MDFYFAAPIWYPVSWNVQRLTFPFPFVHHQSHSLYRWVIHSWTWNKTGQSWIHRWFYWGFHFLSFSFQSLVRPFLGNACPVLAILLTVETRTPMKVNRRLSRQSAKKASIVDDVISVQKPWNRRCNSQWYDILYFWTVNDKKLQMKLIWTGMRFQDIYDRMTVKLLESERIVQRYISMSFGDPCHGSATESHRTESWSHPSLISFSFINFLDSMS